MKPIVYHRRGLSWLYYFFAALFVAFGLLFLVVALGNAVDEEPWSGKRMTVVTWTIGGLSWLMGAPSMWAMAKTYGKNSVSLDRTHFELHAVGGDVSAFDFADVEKVSWNPGLRSRLCTVATKKGSIFFDTRSCPRPGHVAKLIAERASKTLQIEKS